MIKQNNAAEQTLERPKRYFRSIRLDSDIYDINNLSGYALTSHVLYVLGRIEDGLNYNAKERAYTLTGPYGSGKSAFALFLSHLLDNRNDENLNMAFAILSKKDQILATSFANTLGNHGLFPVVLTLRRAPLAHSILDGLIRALQKERQSKMVRSLISEIRNDLLSNQLSSQIVKMRIEAFISVLPKHYKGMMLVLDELGKALEYTARYTGEDVYLLQELAEYASRSGEKPFLLIGILHQAFEQYGEYLNYAARQEWAKVQGRFCDVAFIEPPEQQIRLAVQAITSLNIDKKENDKIKATGITGHIIEKGFIPNGLKPEEILSLAFNAFPLHLTVLLALPYLFKRFAQNERSLFAYLLSSEPFALQDQLTNNCEDLIRLPDLFDYFLANVSGNITKQTYGRRWLEISDALERTPDLILEEVKVLKTIGLLGILGEISFMHPTYEFISLALSDEINNDSVQACLASLQKRSLIVYRRYNKTYKIWEGSDVDIEARLDEGRRKTQGLLLAEDLQNFLLKRPMVARRHSHELGAMRFFELRYLDSIVLSKHLLPTEGIDGTVVCCLPSTQGQVSTFVDWMKNEDISQLKNVLIVVPQQIGAIRDAASELRAIYWVWQNTPELRDDRIARRELAERTSQIEQQLTQAVQHLLDPRPEPLGSNAKWYYLGKKQEQVVNLRGISELLSEVMDHVYHKSPRIKNELINKRGISSAASGARRNLVERMLTNERDPLLGIEGYPPERSIYESVLMAGGLHQHGDISWQLPSKEMDPLNLLPTFNYMEQLIFGSMEEPYPLDILLKELSSPPFGIMDGLFPVILVAFLLSYSNEISLYREGVFIPEPQIADFEVLMRRPELYSIMGSRLQGERKHLVRRIANSLNVKPTTLSVARSLINMVRTLPDHAWRTRNLPEPVLKLRTVIEQARSPERLLFIDIPQALDEQPFTDEPVDSENHINSFFAKLNQAIQEWSSITQARINHAENLLLSACDLPTGKKGWQDLIKTAHIIKDKPCNSDLKPFINRLTVENDLRAIIDSVLAQVAGRPPRSWTDTEVANFPTQAQQIGELFVATTQMYSVLSEKDEVACNELLNKFKSQLNNEAPSHIIKVALSRLLQNIDNFKGEDYE